MEQSISDLLDGRPHIVQHLHKVVVDGAGKWAQTTLNPAILGCLRGELLAAVKREPGDIVAYVVGTDVAKELDNIWQDTAWNHPVRDFYDSVNRKQERVSGYMGMLAGTPAIADDTGFLQTNMLMIALIREGGVEAAIGRAITPHEYPQSASVIDASSELKEVLEVFQSMELLKRCSFDLYSVSADADTAKIIGGKSPNKNFTALSKIDISVNPTAAEWNSKFNLDVPAHKLQLVFLDIELTQEELDARTAMMTKSLSQLVICQRNSKDKVVRYLVFKDLSPETVKISLDASDGKNIASRKVTWMFKTLEESREFPGAL